MANNNYSVTFVGLRTGNTYVVSIGGGSGAAVPLKGGAEPFVTQEDDSDDMFTAIRTQSGYLRIVDDGLDANGNAWNWKDLIPATGTSRPVTLTSGNNVLWRGFLQAQNFGNVLYGNPQVREFPVQCVLSVTEGADINYDQTKIQNFAYLLKQVVDSIPSEQRPTVFYVQGGEHAQAWLLKRMVWRNFVSSDGSAEARCTMYQCLEDMCKFWGWTARTCGASMYLTMADVHATEPNWLVMTYNQLTSMANDTVAGSTSAGFDFFTVDGVSDVYASTDQNEYVLRGYNSALVSVDLGDADDEIIAPFDELLSKDMKNSTYNEGYTVGLVHYTKDILTVNRLDLTASCIEGYASFNDASNSEGDYGGVLRVKRSYTGGAFASLETKYEQLYTDGLYRIRGTVYRPKSDKYEQYDSTEGRWRAGNAEAWIRFGVGKSRQTAKWWNGKEWVNSETNCRLTIGNMTDEMFTRWRTGVPLDPYEETNIINVSGLSGLVFIDILGSNDSLLSNISGEKMFDIHDLKVEFVLNADATKYGPYPNSSWWKVNVLGLPMSRDYKEKNSNPVREQYAVDAIYGSNNAVPHCLGTLLNREDSYLGKMSWAGVGTAKYAEERLAERVTAFWQTSRRSIRSELHGHKIPWTTPMHKIQQDGMTCYPMAISHEWHDDIVQLTTIQI